MKLRSLCLLPVAGAVLAGCVSDGSVDNIFWRKTTWTSFIGGEDIKAACQPGGDSHMRLVYNANRADQVRIYDVIDDGGSGSLRSRVLERAVGSGSKALFSPSQWVDPVDRKVNLTGAELADFSRLVMKSGLRGDAPEGRKFFSGSFFWLVSACVDGKFEFNAWEHPDPAFKKLEFDDFLFEHDPVEIEVALPQTEQRVTSAALSDVNFNHVSFAHYDILIKQDGVAQGQSYRHFKRN